MLTPTRREVATTTASKVIDGAQLWSGVYDGATVRRALRVDGDVVLLLADEREVRLSASAEVAWLHPGRRQ